MTQAMIMHVMPDLTRHRLCYDLAMCCLIIQIIWHDSAYDVAMSCLILQGCPPNVTILNWWKNVKRTSGIFCHSYIDMPPRNKDKMWWKDGKVVCFGSQLCRAHWLWNSHSTRFAAGFAAATAGTFTGESTGTSRQTGMGTSTSFFWPMSPAKCARNVNTKKRKRRRKWTKRSDVDAQCLVADLIRVESWVVLSFSGTNLLF